MNGKSYSKFALMSDQSLIKLIGNYIQHNRLNKNLSQDELSNAAGISRSTLSLLERGESVKLATLLQVLRVLDLLHIMEVFQVNEEISPLDYAKLKKKQKKRASGAKGQDTEEDLGW